MCLRIICDVVSLLCFTFLNFEVSKEVLYVFDSITLGRPIPPQRWEPRNARTGERTGRPIALLDPNDRIPHHGTAVDNQGIFADAAIRATTGVTIQEIPGVVYERTPTYTPAQTQSFSEQSQRLASIRNPRTRWGP